MIYFAPYVEAIVIAVVPALTNDNGFELYAFGQAR
jgi:hypothetical protein